MKQNTRSRRTRQRPRTRKIQRHQDQPMLWPGDVRPVIRNRQVRVAIQERGEVTPYGGLALAHDLAMRLGIDRDINASMYLLKLKLPYFESDHLLTHAYNQYVGGTCIEDIAHLQHSDAVKHLTGACRIPDPSTAGDFLRRFNRSNLRAFQQVIDHAREKVWRQMPNARKHVATIDMDSTIKPVYGDCKQGADFSYTGKWSYHPLLLTLAETRELLRTLNRPGNAGSADGATEALKEVLPMVQRHFDRVYVRGDSAFYQKAIIAECVRRHAGFALVMDSYAGLIEMAENLPESAWKPFSAHAARKVAATDPRRKTRRKRERVRARKACERNYKTLGTIEQWAAEFNYTIPGGLKTFGLDGSTFRVVVKRQLVETRQGQQLLYTDYVYRFIITNIPRREMDAAELLCFAYGRCDQENIIEQAKNGIAALRMPTGELLANTAFLMAGQLAWCLRAWLSLLALPKETTRWEWKWFRQAFVYVAARITQSGRRAKVYFAGCHRFVDHLVIASQRLQCFTFT